MTMTKSLWTRYYAVLMLIMTNLKVLENIEIGRTSLKKNEDAMSITGLRGD